MKAYLAYIQSFVNVCLGRPHAFAAQRNTVTVFFGNLADPPQYTVLSGNMGALSKHRETNGYLSELLMSSSDLHRFGGVALSVALEMI